MAQNEYRINLSSPFPMLTKNQGRTIMGATVGEAPRAENAPGVLYCHNVMPSNYGMNSIAYKEVIPAFPSLIPSEEFVDVRPIFGDEKSRVYLAFTTLGRVYALNLLGSPLQWKLLPSTSPYLDTPLDADDITIGNVNGISYIYYKNKGCFTYDEASESLQSVGFTGLNTSTTLGILGSYGYLVAYSEDAIVWSSTLDPTDFTPSAVTGAGGGNVAELRGDIKFGVSNSLGMLLYTEGNVVAGQYTGNAQFPFRFKEVEDSKGGISLDRTAYQANSGAQYVFTKAGIQAINISKAETILPDVTDFLAGRVFEDFNETTNQFEITELSESQTMLKKMKYVASRYLVMSYGINTFTHAIVLDTSLNKLGKLKLDHVDVFEYVNTQTEIAKESIALLQSDGTSYIVDFSTTNNNSNGVLIAGKLQLTRDEFLSLQGVDIENVQAGDTVTCYDLYTLDGKNFFPVQGYQYVAADNFNQFLFRVEAKNHSILLKGKFDCNTIQITYFQRR